MREIFEIVFSKEFVPRHFCGEWHPGWPQAYQIANGVIFAAYLLIPACIALGVVQTYIEPEKATPQLSRSETIGARVTVALFVLLCGIGHFLDGVLAFLVPMYHLLTVWHSITAIVSLWAIRVVFRSRLEFARIL